MTGEMQGMMAETVAEMMVVMAATDPPYLVQQYNLHRWSPSTRQNLARPARRQVTMAEMRARSRG